MARFLRVLLAASFGCLLLSTVAAPAQALEYRTQPIQVAGAVRQVTVPAGYQLELLTPALDERFHGDALVALRGSWGTRPSGGASGDKATRRRPGLVRVRFEDGEAQEVQDLVTGFQLSDGRRWAGPVGVAIGPDGARYFTSGSGANALFRLKRTPQASNH